MKKNGGFYQHILVTALVCNVITVLAITNSRDKDVLNLNGIQDGSKVNEKDKYKDGVVGTETQEKRSFFKPDVERRGSFYPSASGHGGTGFSVGSGINVGGTGYGPNYHTSGNGYSYGTPTVGYPPVLYGGSYPAPIGPSSSGGGYGLSGGGGGHFGGGGSFGLVPAGHSGGGGYNKALALKGLLIPIAGVALLGAAAALAKSNPLLLQLGVISGKKKRSIMMNENVYPVNPYVRPEYRQI